MDPLPLVYVGLLLVHAVTCFPTGAPTRACGTMEPGHSQIPQTGPSPFTTVPETTSLDANGALNVVLQSTTSDTFKGYLLMAFDSSGVVQGPIGTFKNPSDGQVISCTAGIPNAVTHTGRHVKSGVTVTWIPPADFVGTVVFRTTYVMSFTTYWVGQTSSPVSVRARSPASTTPGISPVPPSSTTPATATTTVKPNNSAPISAVVSPVSSFLTFLAFFVTFRRIF